MKYASYWCALRSEDNLWEIVLYSSTLEVLGIELRPSGLVASTFTC